METKLVWGIRVDMGDGFDGRYLYMGRGGGWETSAIQAKIWKTAAGAYKALQVKGDRVPVYMARRLELYSTKR